MKENKFQASLISQIKERFNGCTVLKNDANYIQGIPDLLILFKDKWAMLECKKTFSASRRPNQEFYISKFNEESFARFINPENFEKVLEDLSKFFGGVK